MPKGIPKNGINKGQFKKGVIPWNKGKKFPGVGGNKKGCLSWNKGMTIKDDRIRRLVQAGAKARKGKAPWNKGKKLFYKVWLAGKKGIHISPNTEFKKGQFLLNKHPNWKGGKSFEPYGLEFNEELKEVIRNRDRRKCQLCEKTELDNKVKLSIHHIDYNKRNNHPTNLISLCMKCHMKTNYNRDYWEEHFVV